MKKKRTKKTTVNKKERKIFSTKKKERVFSLIIPSSDEGLSSYLLTRFSIPSSDEGIAS